MARLRSTINGIDDWNRLFELVEKQGSWGPAGFGLWLLGYGSDLMTSSRVSKSTAWTMNYAELLRAMKEPLSAAKSLHDLQGLQVKPLWGIGCEWWSTWADYSSSELMQSLAVRSVQAAPKFCLRGPIYRNCYAAQSISGEERDELSGKDDDEPTKAEARRSTRARKRMHDSTEGEIEKEQKHESEAHALLTAGSDGLAEVVERVKNNNSAGAWAPSLKY